MIWLNTHCRNYAEINHLMLEKCCISKDTHCQHQKKIHWNAGGCLVTQDLLIETTGTEKNLSSERWDDNCQGCDWTICDAVNPFIDCGLIASPQLFDLTGQPDQRQPMLWFAVSQRRVCMTWRTYTASHIILPPSMWEPGWHMGWKESLWCWSDGYRKCHVCSDYPFRMDQGPNVFCPLIWRAAPFARLVKGWEGWGREGTFVSLPITWWLILWGSAVILATSINGLQKTLRWMVNCVICHVELNPKALIVNFHFFGFLL